MRWHTEPWRKLYVGKSPAWLRLPVSARGLGFLLLTYCDDNGRIDIGDEPAGVAIAYLMGARPKEHKRISEDVEALLADGYLVLDGQSIAIRNYDEAQDRTPAAKRTAEWRARKDEEKKQKASPRDVTRDVTCDVRETSPRDALVTSPMRRSRDDDPIRSDPSRSDPPVVPLGDPPAEPAPRPAKAKGPKPATRQPTDDVDPWLAALDVPAVDSAPWGPQVAAWLDHHAAKGSRFADWAAAWRTWSRNAVKFGHVESDPATAKRSLQAPPVQRETSMPRAPDPNPRLEAHMARMVAEGRDTPMPANPLQALLAMVSKTPTAATGCPVAASGPPSTPRESSGAQPASSAGDQRGAA